MEFKGEIIKKLADEGIVFTKGIACPKDHMERILIYRANYGHAQGIVFAGCSRLGCLPHFTITCDCMETVGKAFPEDTDPEKVLRDVAEATGNMDRAIENFQETIGGYTDIE